MTCESKAQALADAEMRLWSRQSTILRCIRRFVSMHSIFRIYLRS